jgi:hypothetical protein
MQHAIETPSILAPVSTPAFAIRDPSFFVLAITAATLVIVAGVQLSPERVVTEGHHA